MGLKICPALHACLATVRLPRLGRKLMAAPYNSGHHANATTTVQPSKNVGGSSRFWLRAAVRPSARRAGGSTCSFSCASSGIVSSRPERGGLKIPAFSR